MQVTSVRAIGEHAVRLWPQVLAVPAGREARGRRGLRRLPIDHNHVVPVGRVAVSNLRAQTLRQVMRWRHFEVHSTKPQRPRTLSETHASSYVTPSWSARNTAFNADRSVAASGGGLETCASQYEAKPGSHLALQGQ